MNAMETLTSLVLRLVAKYERLPFYFTFTKIEFNIHNKVLLLYYKRNFTKAKIKLKHTFYLVRIFFNFIEKVEQFHALLLHKLLFLE